MAAWNALASAHAAITERVSHALAQEAGIPLSWFLVLRRLAEAEEGMLRMTELAHRTPLTKSGLTRLVDRMVAGGLVARRECPTDRRGALAQLTEDGSQALAKALRVYEREIESSFGAHLAAREADVLARALDVVARKAADGDPPPACG